MTFPRMRSILQSTAGVIALALLLSVLVPRITNAADESNAPVVLRWWHHPADADNVKAVMHEVARRSEAAYPGSSVKFTWYQKKEMWPALRSAFLAGQAPDLFYFDNDVLEFIQGGYLADLSEGINWNKIEPWAKEFWTRPGPYGTMGVWALPVDASTDELYYNKKLFADLGIDVPEDLRFTSDELVEVVKKCTAGGLSAFAVGVGDRPYPGAYMTNYLLLSQLGEEDLYDLWSGGGRVTWKDPRVQRVLTYHKQLIDLGGYPKSISSLKLGEAHRYFHTQHKACMMPVGSWYTFRAFLPPESGGQPADFQLGMLNYPTMENGKGNDRKFISIGVSLAVNAKTKHMKEVKNLLNIVATPETGAMWIAKTVNQTTLKTDVSKIESPYADYLKMFAKANADVKPTTLSWQVAMKPGMSETYSQVINSAFPAGIISVEEATKRLEAARVKGR